MNLAAIPLQQADPLGYRALMPAGAPSRLLLLLHGVGGNETNLVPLGMKVAGDTLVVFPRAPLVAGPGQYAWFPVHFDASGPRMDFAQAQHSASLLQEFIAGLQARHGIAPARTAIAGFSQGGIMSASVGLTAPDLVAGFAVLSGRILPEIEDFVAPPESLRRVDAFVAHGAHDTKLPPAWAERADALLTRVGVPHRTVLYPAGHEIPAAMQDDFLAWFEQAVSR
ncbi:alpha/beta hydrolase-fold protein [Lysobacter sp. Root494]|uniref:alpha/beta hydrolase n=1 Tax=Lysobacter sp. Root494 TaxID=1736549 RepID=UPI0006F230EA|nr:alpha/beta hydrolase-fold protein [Lysobacter sp. Root494]KQY52245.1 hypothetical protein ASD14_06290 [Lysobacter sp. Root494]